MKKAIATAVLTLGLTGCSAMNMNTLNNTDISDVDFSQEFKQGEACETTILFFGPFGSSSVVDAAKNGGVSKVEVVEQEFSSKILFGQRCTIVYGS
jgi:hypothetical protein